MTVKRMDNVGIVVEDIDAAIEFFTELGLELEGRAPIEGDWGDGVTGLRDMRVERAIVKSCGLREIRRRPSSLASSAARSARRPRNARRRARAVRARPRRRCANALRPLAAA